MLLSAYEGNKDEWMDEKSYESHTRIMEMDQSNISFKL